MDNQLLKECIIILTEMIDNIANGRSDHNYPLKALLAEKLSLFKDR